MIKRCSSIAAFLVAAVSPLAATAQGFPDKPVRLIVPYAAGTQTDVVARQIAMKVAEGLAQPVVIENRAGAGGIIGAELVAKSAPDGYTLLLGTSQTHAINKYLYRQLPYDPIAGFEPVARLASVPMVLVVNASLPVKNVADLVAYAKARPGQLNFASSGIGSSAHLAGEYFNNEAGLRIAHIPYKDVGQIFAGFASGHLTLMFYAYAPLLPQVQSGALRIIGNTGPQRSAFAPQAPTMAESGFPNFVMSAWFAMYAPPATPKRVIDVLASAVARALQSAEVRQKLLTTGTDPYLSTPEELREFTRSELERYRKVVELTGAKLD